jgi:biopolymer transport protein ExbB
MTMGWHEMWRAGSGLARVGRKATLVLLLALAAVTTLSASPAKAWWNDEWQLRKKITIDASAAGANITDPIGTTPVLVRLHPGNFRFGATKEDGSDLRFVAGDDKTPLKHHIEKFDALLGEALVWVAVPNVQAGAKTDFWLYYGNKKAVPTSDPKGTYDTDQQLVYHFSERGTPSLDSTVWSNNAQSVVQPADGALIATGLRLDGHSPLTLPASSSLAIVGDNAGWTLSMWVKPAAQQPNAALYSRRDGANALEIGFDNAVPFVEVSNGGATQRSAAAVPVPVNSWHHLAVVAGSGKVTLYLDGNAYAALDASLPALNTIALVGGDTSAPNVAPAAAPALTSPAPSADGTTPAPAADTTAAPAASDAAAAAPVAAPVATAGFTGDIDELEISKIARSAGFIRMAAIGQGLDQGKLVSFSVDEETASWLSGYFAVILKSVTLDGWVVIGILVVMAAVSWVVMLDRASYLGKQAKANARFMKSFRDVDFDLTLLSRGDAEAVATLGGRLGNRDAAIMRSSSLYRIYHICADEIRRRSRTTAMPVLSANSIAAMRAALDGGVVKEMQRLNRLMVILTIAISGGPFLGLLGTVVGVMITFAAIAASGDVNVNAIAPGIAAALVATVAGLGVAIPALFGYNYLISRIKDLTSDIQIFVDEMVTRVAELYSADRPDPVEQRMAAE